MKRCSLTLFTTLLLTLLLGCRNTTHVEAQLDRLDSLVNEQPDSVLALLDSLLPDVVGDDALTAHWNLLCAAAEDKSDRPLLFDLRIRPAYDYYRDQTNGGTRGDSILLHRFALSCFYLGVYYYHCDSTTQLEQLMQKSVEVAKSCGDHYTAYLALTYLSNQIKIDSPAAATQMAEEALHEYHLTNHQSTYNIICLLLNAGNICIYSSDKQKALDYFEKAIDCSLSTPDSAFYVYILSSIASFYDLTGNSQAAVAYMNQALIHFPDSDNSWNLTYARIYLHHGDLDKAEEQLKHSDTLTPLKKFHWFKYMQMVKIRKHDLEGSQQLNDSLSYYSNKMYLDALAQKNTYFQENLKKEKSIYLQQQRVKKLTAIYIALLVGFLILIGFVLLHTRHRHKMKVLEATHLAKQAQQDARQQKLINQKNLQRIALLKNQLEKQSDIMDYFKMADNVGRKMMHLTNDDWHNLEVALDDSYNFFVSRLRQQFPQMNEEGLRLCMLEKIGLTTHQMSNIFSISPQSVTKRKQRLKKDYLYTIDADKFFDEIIEDM